MLIIPLTVLSTLKKHKTVTADDIVIPVASLGIACGIGYTVQIGDHVAPTPMATPEPQTFLPLGLGLALLCVRRKR